MEQVTACNAAGVLRIHVLAVYLPHLFIQILSHQCKRAARGQQFTASRGADHNAFFRPFPVFRLKANDGLRSDIDNQHTLAVGFGRRFRQVGWNGDANCGLERTGNHGSVRTGRIERTLPFPERAVDILCAVFVGIGAYNLQRRITGFQTETFRHGRRRANAKIFRGGIDEPVGCVQESTSFVRRIETGERLRFNSVSQFAVTAEYAVLNFTLCVRERKKRNGGVFKRNRRIARGNRFRCGDWQRVRIAVGDDGSGRDDGDFRCCGSNGRGFLRGGTTRNGSDHCDREQQKRRFFPVRLHIHGHNYSERFSRIQYLSGERRFFFTIYQNYIGSFFISGVCCKESNLRKGESRVYRYCASC
ncbi:hypothetical protein SDC9_97403 [bioreactor metagenome]|uniref:Uncharacterized protein n=1 Tax=bioreactor metagenome TaxID=1076179 RepID=A0A645AEE9_9ZZZZ